MWTKRLFFIAGIAALVTGLGTGLRAQTAASEGGTPVALITGEEPATKAVLHPRTLGESSARLDANPLESLVALLVRPDELSAFAPVNLKNLDAPGIPIVKTEPTVKKAIPVEAKNAAPKHDNFPIRVSGLEEKLGVFGMGEKDSLLCAAIRKGMSDAVLGLLHEGADPERVGKEGQTAVWMAVAYRDMKSLETLLRWGADANATLNSPVDAGFRERLGGCKSLQRALEHDQGMTPLMIGAGRGDVQLVETLMKYGGKAGSMTKIGKHYPVNYAMDGNYLYVCQILFRVPEDKRGDKVIINLSRQRSTVYHNGKAIMSSAVSTGRPGFRTPTGEYIITDKHRTKTSTLYDAEMPWFMRLSSSAIGMHEGNCSSSYASHGCIRMPGANAQKYFNTLPVGTRVDIVQ